VNNERQALSLRADRLGIIASALCFVHCIMTPVVLSLSAVWAHYLPSEEGFHRVLAMIVAAVGCFAIVNGYRKHRHFRVLSLMSGGLLFIFAGAYLGDRLPSHIAEVAVTMTGSSLMITAHLINHTFCKNCRRCSETH
jgi:uncharacterized membrane protein YfcA